MANRDFNKVKRTIQDFSLGAGEGEGGTTVIANPELVGDEPDLTGLEVDGAKYKVPQGGSSNLGLKYQDTKDVAGFFYTDLYLVADNDDTITNAYFNSSKLKQILIDANVDLDKVLDIYSANHIDLNFIVPWSDLVPLAGSDSIPVMTYKKFIVRLGYEVDSCTADKLIYVANINHNGDEERVEVIPITVPDFEGTTWGDLLDYLIENPDKYFQILVRGTYSEIHLIGTDIVGGITAQYIDPTIPAFSTVCYIDPEATDIYFADANYIGIRDLKDAVEFNYSNE